MQKFMCDVTTFTDVKGSDVPNAINMLTQMGYKRDCITVIKIGCGNYYYITAKKAR